MTTRRQAVRNKPSPANSAPASSVQPLNRDFRRRDSANGASSGSARLPCPELLKQFILLLWGHRPRTGRLATLIDKTREHNSHFVRLGSLCDLHIALQPGIRRRKAAPARQVSCAIDFLPLRIATWRKQSLKTCKERF